ncbi:MAG: signal peptidase II [Gammaproteobacteria bacterium]|nr:signal peptidase II [Gammaproteobacteria bacterium]MDD9863367.1 signal peptidase II [Gammaproteobacteria bacterium]
MRWLWLSLAVVVLDRASKVLAEQWLGPGGAMPLLPGLRLALGYNAGAAFGILSDAGGWQRWFLSGCSLLVCALILLWLRRLPPSPARLPCALALVFGGAAGNLYDRLAYGRVVDFIDLYLRHWHWPAFNVADAAITVGAALLFLDLCMSPAPDSTPVRGDRAANSGENRRRN